MGIVLSAMIAACVQPIEPTPIPSPTILPSATPPVPATDTAPTFPPQAISLWIQTNLGDTVNNIDLFTEFQAGPDHIIGFTYQNAADDTCAGFVLTTLATSTIWNGDRRCAPRGTAVIVAPLVFALTNNEFYVATYGWINPDVVANAGGVAIQFPDGSSVNQLLISNGFVILRQGLDFPTQLVVADTNGNLLTTVPIQ